MRFRTLYRTHVRQWGVGVPSCSFCGTQAGSFLEVGGAFPLLMCPGCQAARSSPEPGLPTTTVDMFDIAPEEPDELLAHREPGAPWLEWGCPVRDCDLWVILPWHLEGHTAAEHPGWVARWEAKRMRVVYRRSGG